MASENLSPRLKMISLMYLVLMALLALNVSKEVLDGFLVVNESLTRNNTSFEDKVEQVYKEFERDYTNNPTEVGPYWEKALDAKDLTTELRKYFDDIKLELISITEKLPLDSVRGMDLYHLKSKDNFDAPTAYFIGDSYDGSEGKAGELRIKIDEFQSKMIDLIEPKYRHRIKINLNTKDTFYNADGEPQNWELHHFYHNILIADITILNNIISDINHLEFDVIKTLYDAISAEDFHYDQIAARVISRSNYVFIGEEYQAEIIVSASDSSQIPEAYYKMGVDSLSSNEVGSAKLITGSNGKIRLNILATNEGTYKYAGLIRIKNKMGDVTEYPFSDEYIVARPSLTVSAKQMNVLYLGVDNPISVSVPGIPREKLVAEISCGELKPDRFSSDWIAVVPTGYRVAEVKVSAQINGIYKEMGTQTFRIKELPNPIASIANRNQGFINKDLLKAAGALEANMPDDFEYNLSFQVKSFIMTTQRGFTMIHATSNSNLLTEEMKRNIDMTNRGQNILFEDIIAISPDGKERQLAPIVLSVN